MPTYSLLPGILREAMKQAQIRVLVSDASDPSSVRDATRMLTDALSFNTTPISASESLVEDESADISQSITPTKMFFIRNKIDNLDTKVSDSSSKGANKQEEEDLNSDVQQFDVSCVTGDGISSFESALTQAALSLLQPSDTADGADTTESAVITRDRHRSHVKRCVRHLDEFIDAGLPMDAAAEELRYYLLLLLLFYSESSMTVFIA